MDKILHDFGFVTACHAGDYALAKATCASIRCSLPDVPIALIVDGEVNTDDIIRAHGVIPLPVSELPDPTLRQACSRSYFAKWACFWTAPFQRFVYLDSDALAVGAWAEFIHDQSWEFCIFAPPSSDIVEPAALRKYFFDPQEIARLDPLFEWEHQPYFCAGAFAASAGFISPAQFLSLLEVSRSNPTMFDGTDQGMLNYLVLKARAHGKGVQVRNMQFILPDHDPLEALERFGHDPSKTPSLPPCIVHYCGIKPWLHQRRHEHALFTEYRLLHYRKLYGTGLAARAISWFRIWKEECACMLGKIKGRISRWMRRPQND